MATLDINAIRDYLLEVGCKIEYQILVHAFKKHLYNENPEIQGKIRTQFKDYVNRLATVCLENNMKFIILRPEFRPTTVNMTTSNHNSPTDQAKTSETKLSQTHAQQVRPNPAMNDPDSPLRLQTQLIPPPVPEHKTAQHITITEAHQQAIPIASQYQSSRTLQHQQQQQLQNQEQQQQQQQQQQTMTVPQRRREHQPPPLQIQQIPQYREFNNQAFDRQQQQLNQRLSSPQVQPQVQPMSPAKESNHDKINHDVQDGMPPPPPPVTKRTHLSQRPESLNLSSSSIQQTEMPPPRPPPRRRQSTASLFKPSTTSQQSSIEKSREIHDLAKKSPGRVKEHALKLNSFTSSNDISALIPIRNNIMKENNRLSRDPSIAGSLVSALQRNGSHLTNRSRSSHREDESDSSSLQPIDPLRRKWSIEACNCNYNGLLTLLREDPKLAHYKDMVNGYTALHWAAKFGNLDIIKLIAGTHSVSANIKSSAGYTPLHIAKMFNRTEAADLLLKSYKANPNIRDHSGKRPAQYNKSVTSN